MRALPPWDKLDTHAYQLQKNSWPFLIKKKSVCTFFPSSAKLWKSRPSRGELGDLLQRKLLVVEVGKIWDFQILGRGFYQIEFEDHEGMTKSLDLTPLLI